MYSVQGGSNKEFHQDVTYFINRNIFQKFHSDNEYIVYFVLSSHIIYPSKKLPAWLQVDQQPDEIYHECSARQTRGRSCQRKQCLHTVSAHSSLPISVCVNVCRTYGRHSHKHTWIYLNAHTALWTYMDSGIRMCSWKSAFFYTRTNVKHSQNVSFSPKLSGSRVYRVRPKPLSNDREYSFYPSHSLPHMTLLCSNLNGIEPEKRKESRVGWKGLDFTSYWNRKWRSFSRMMEFNAESIQYMKISASAILGKL